MKIILSSKATPFFKFAMPGTIFYVGVQGIFLTYGFLIGFAIVLWLLFVLWRVAAPLKNVFVEGDCLCISNYLRTVRIPLTAVAKSYWSGPYWGTYSRGPTMRLLAIRLRGEDFLEKEVRFILTVEPVDGAVAESLLALVNRALRISSSEKGFFCSSRNELTTDGHSILEGTTDDNILMWNIFCAIFGGIVVLSWLIDLFVLRDATRSILTFVMTIVFLLLVALGGNTRIRGNSAPGDK